MTDRRRPNKIKSEDFPTQDSTMRHPLDAEFRKAGWEIHVRPDEGPDVWIKDGETRTVDELREMVK